MKLNLGCGNKKLPGFVNVDIQGNADIVADVREVPLDDSVADELHAYHVIEHFYLWEVGELLAEWRRLLKPGGRLVLELPSIELAARNLLAGLGDQMCMWPFYGDPGHRDPYMCHRWGYTPSTITKTLEAAGFRKVKVMPPQTHGARANRDMRVEAVK